MTKRIGAAALVLATLAGLTGCEGDLPQPGSVGSAQSPDLTEAQEKKIRKETLAVLSKADETKSPDGLSERVTGPALDIRTSELTIAKATGSMDPRATIPEDIAQTIIPTQTGWPRYVFSITTTTADQQSKRLLVFRQENARSNYRLWGAARLFQGAKLPKFPIPQIGATAGEADDSGLVMTPQDAVRQYADVLQNDSKSQYADKFSSDFFREDMRKLVSAVEEGMQRNHGTQSQTFEPVKGQIAVMRSSEDGGDLVVAQINSEWTRAAGEGRESQPASDAERALFGGGKATSTMKVSYVNLVALYVPPAGSKAKVTAVGVERQPIKVEAL
nr:hypothetical protein [Bifidobacterium bohemicum]